VLADPAKRRTRIAAALERAAQEAGGELVEDPGLLDEVADLVEWPGVVTGGFDGAFLELPQEILLTTLRHHQKCFSVRAAGGGPLARFLAVANTDTDPGGHVRRGNEWVVGGRLDDARFFWREDRKRTLESLSDRLGGMVFHAKAGTYADKAARLRDLSGRLGETIGLDEQTLDRARRAAGLCKNDLLTGTVGEFPELQGRVGGLLLEAEGEPSACSRAVYEHYQPVGAEDDPPATIEGCVVSVVDKLDSVAVMIAAGETPTGSRDPFGLRRASSGIWRIAIERRWPLTLAGLCRLGGGEEGLLAFLHERLVNYLRESGSTQNEILAVLRQQVSDTDWQDWPLHDLVARLETIRTVRERHDFEQLADLTKRVDNILTKGQAAFQKALAEVASGEGFDESQQAAQRLWRMVEEDSTRIEEMARTHRYGEVIELLAGYVQPVEQFFDDVLVINSKQPRAMLHRRELIVEVKGVLTRCFDVRELAGQADRRAS
jgi:glycyl-tRNA synthetase beta chain